MTAFTAGLSPQVDRCQGRPPLCRRCHRELVLDPTGPWCRTCRTADAGAPAHPPCPMPPVATGATTRTRGLRLCRAHARRLADPAGPGAVLSDPPAPR
jgi:hypothetical protein